MTPIEMNDTIIALATPSGEGAIAVIRMSGINAIKYCDVYFKGKNLTKVKGHTVHYGKIVQESGEMIDECLVSVFKNPRSYTREDSVEISCHGSSYIIEQIIQLYIRAGARQAKAGEFTQRAFLNGQLDLSQAEAVADLIASENKTTHHLALSQMRGGFSNVISDLRQELIDFAALIELELDFSEEDVEFANRDRLLALIHKIKDVVEKLITSFVTGNVLKKGIPTVIAGRPNAGKSTLLNSLLNEDRAIVSDIAGTTRDTIEASLNIKGVKFRLIDTAGIRDSKDEIEKIGVSRALSEIRDSALILYVFDISQTTPTQLSQELELAMKEVLDLGLRPKLILVANKIDQKTGYNLASYDLDGFDIKEIIGISALYHTRMDELRARIYSLSGADVINTSDTIVSTTRHYEALTKALDSLNSVENHLKSQTSSDFIAMDIRQSLHYLGEITGEVSTDDLLESIFTRFCIGK